MRILAVDDERPALELLTEVIEEAEEDAVVIPFDSPDAVLEYVRTETCDVCFLDIEMPEMNGLELAYQIKSIKPDVNIIFVTGYSQYASNAFALRASGYVKKPATYDKVKAELDNLRFPVRYFEGKERDLCVVTFGNFDVYSQNRPLIFKRTKSKELFAYLVDQAGAVSSAADIISTLFPNNAESYFRVVKRDLEKALAEIGEEDILVKSWGKLGIRREKLLCDYYEYLDGNPDALNLYRGAYMLQYDWAQPTHLL